MTWRNIVGTCACAVAGLIAGCGGEAGPEMHRVTGQVTYDGQPVENGRITFRKTGDDGKSFATEIKGGGYELEAEAGAMAVEITASRLIPGKFDNSNGTPEPVGEMYIPKKYNAATTLTAEVTPAGPNEFPFALTAK